MPSTTTTIKATFRIIMTIEPTAGHSALLRLLTWMSPAFPVGAFAYSHGLEAAIADGKLPNADAVADWIASLLQRGSGWNDLVLFTEAHRGACDSARLQAVTELGQALSGSRERRTETMDLGAAFMAASAPWGSDETTEAMPYPVAVGALAARNGVRLQEALVAFAHGFAANLLAAAVRLVPLGQREAVAVLHRLEPVVLAVADRAALSTLDDLGSATVLSEIAAMRHETLSTRLFRS